METLINIASGVTLLSSTNHRIVNINNIYNFIIDIMKDGCEDDKLIIIQSIKIHIGLTFYCDFKAYCNKKLIYDDPIVKMMNKMND